ncbi:hypothetical protein BBJ28_00021250 [Nothophytophthora sp. Chile5]|nr:hypothetical protein BBJ28_00021250 [Nothophytophthora sp. Chile5]
MAEAVVCPVCFAAFPATSGDAFALHVASCTSSSPSPPASPSASPSSAAPLQHCPRCNHVYATGTLAHEISFHEHECARVNDLPGEDDGSADDDSSVSSSRKGKRARGGHRVAPAVSAPSVTLFPSTCFLCSNGGRGLLRCGGSCARAAHQHCVDALQAPTVGGPLSVAEKKQAAESWRCAQCTRGLHSCHRCGFLGHGSNGMRKCSVIDCGFFFHLQCLPNAEEEQETVHAAFVCPRHTCTACGIQETDMRRCKSCTKCYSMTHLRCPRGSTSAVQTTPAQTEASMLGGLDSNNLFLCSKHDGEPSTVPPASSDVTNSLRLRLAAGDVVLILEFANALLPPSAKSTAPDAANHWGVVLSAEEMEPQGCGNQLLSVRTFADDRVLAVPNRYALRVAAAGDFARPLDLLRHCLQRHAMVELQLHEAEVDGNVDTTNRILRASTAAFSARIEAMGMTEAQVRGEAEQGLARWRRFQALPSPRQYDGLSDSAPVYLYVDTRGLQPQRRVPSKSSVRGAAIDTEDGDEDVTMTDADAENSSGAAGADASRNSSSPSGAVGTEPAPDVAIDADDVPLAKETTAIALDEDGTQSQAQRSVQAATPTGSEAEEDNAGSMGGAASGEAAVLNNDVTTATVSSTVPVSENNVMFLDAHLSETLQPPRSGDANTEVVNMEEERTSAELQPLQAATSGSLLNSTAAAVVADDADESMIMPTSVGVSIPAAREDTDMQSTQDTEQELDSQSQLQTAGTSSAIAGVGSVPPPAINVGSDTSTADVSVHANVDANSSKKRAANNSEGVQVDGGDTAAKRQKVGSEVAARSNTGVNTPTSSSGLSVAAQASSIGGSASLNLHISPMSTFARTKQQQPLQTPHQKKKTLTRKQKVLAELPPPVLAELEREVVQYLERADGSSSTRASPLWAPADADAFPCAAHADRYRPAFYRPTVMLNYRGLRRPGVEAVSRLLVSQDKRNIKCFIQTTDAAALASAPCPHRSQTASPAFVLVDLLSLCSFRELEVMVRTRLVEALDQRVRYTREIFRMEALQARRWLEQQRRKKASDQLPISLWYCAADGSRHRLEMKHPTQREMQVWLCFCANVCHLTVVISLPDLAPSATPAAVQQQQIPVASNTM